MQGNNIGAVADTTSDYEAFFGNAEHLQAVCTALRRNFPPVQSISTQLPLYVTDDPTGTAMKVSCAFRKNSVSMIMFGDCHSATDGIKKRLCNGIMARCAPAVLSPACL